MTLQDQASQAVARRDDSPAGLIKQYSNSFEAVLPSHIKPATWVRLAQGALKKGKRTGSGQTELEIAAANNPAVFLASLLDAARLGLEPGTEQYYLTPRKVKGRLEILGIVGYQGIIELIYRAGAVSSVIAEVVYEKDVFRYQPGRDETPTHEIDWDSEDRGKLRLVYAYARMKDGAFSRVVVLNRADINRIKASAQGSGSEYSPWQQHEAAMWLKSAVRQLAKWVPTSAEYIREQLRAVRDVQNEGAQCQGPGAPEGFAPRSIDDVIDAEVVDTEHGQVDTVTGEVLDPDDYDAPPAGFFEQQEQGA
ncbi:recombinase RecT [Georgenia faecalis]|uniref:recombinase RecT n=1 Tax=Georgenia faecalis TaxID=2483799 RepID=UPI000FD7C7A6|nr:recombinase RecT [Georgenia faecalis]